MTLTPADIDRWDPAEVQAVSWAATTRAESADAAAAALAQLPGLATWSGVAGEAARALTVSYPVAHADVMKIPRCEFKLVGQHLLHEVHFWSRRRVSCANGQINGRLREGRRCFS